MGSFDPPVLPRVSNSTGVPTPPSGFHPVSNTDTVTIPTHGMAPAGPSTGLPAANIHKSAPGRLLRGLLRGDPSYDVLESVW